MDFGVVLISLAGMAFGGYFVDTFIHERAAARPPVPIPQRDCVIHGHDYYACYDEHSPGPIKLEGYSSPADFRKLVDTMKPRTYIHSVCRHCGLTVDRPMEKK